MSETKIMASQVAEGDVLRKGARGKTFTVASIKRNAAGQVWLYDTEGNTRYTTRTAKFVKLT